MGNKIVTSNNEFNQYVLQYTAEYITGRNLSYGEYRLIEFFREECLIIKDNQKYKDLRDWANSTNKLMDALFSQSNASLQDKLIIKDYGNTIFLLLFNEIKLQITKNNDNEED